jgi:hypothetical protein
MHWLELSRLTALLLHTHLNSVLCIDDSSCNRVKTEKKYYQLPSDLHACRHTNWYRNQCWCCNAPIPQCTRKSDGKQILPLAPFSNSDLGTVALELLFPPNTPPPFVKFSSKRPPIIRNLHIMTNLHYCKNHHIATLILYDGYRTNYQGFAPFIHFCPSQSKHLH